MQSSSPIPGIPYRGQARPEPASLQARPLFRIVCGPAIGRLYHRNAGLEAINRSNSHAALRNRVRPCHRKGLLGHTGLLRTSDRAQALPWRRQRALRFDENDPTPIDSMHRQPRPPRHVRPLLLIQRSRPSRPAPGAVEGPEVGAGVVGAAVGFQHRRGAEAPRAVVAVGVAVSQVARQPGRPPSPLPAIPVHAPGRRPYKSYDPL